MGLFFHPPLSRASASAFWSSSRSTANPEDLFPIGGPIVSFFFTSLLSRTATRFLLLVPAPPPFLASAGSTILLLSPSFFRHLRTFVTVLVVSLRLRPTSLDYPPPSRDQLFLSHLWSWHRLARWGELFRWEASVSGIVGELILGRLMSFRF